MHSVQFTGPFFAKYRTIPFTRVKPVSKLVTSNISGVKYLQRGSLEIKLSVSSSTDAVMDC